LLILARKKDRRIVIGDSIEIVIVEIGNGWAKIGIEAPKNISVYRKELVDEVVAENIRAARSATQRNSRSAADAAGHRKTTAKAAELVLQAELMKEKGE